MPYHSSLCSVAAVFSENFIVDKLITGGRLYRIDNFYLVGKSNSTVLTTIIFLIINSCFLILKAQTQCCSHCPFL